jgi:hypothetical protein
MITSQQLSDRIFDFFDKIFADNKTDFGFNADSSLAFKEDRQNNDIRSTDQTILFYRIEETHPIGNTNTSYSRGFNRDTKKENLFTIEQVNVLMNILSKKKGMAKDAMKAFFVYIQSTRIYEATYDLPFNLSLINLERMPRDLTALEEGAWVERMELTITFVYNDIVEIGDIKFTLTPSVVEDVKDIIKFETIVKNDND